MRVIKLDTKAIDELIKNCVIALHNSGAASVVISVRFDGRDQTGKPESISTGFATGSIEHQLELLDQFKEKLLNAIKEKGN